MCKVEMETNRNNRNVLELSLPFVQSTSANALKTHTDTHAHMDMAKCNNIFAIIFEMVR